MIRNAVILAVCALLQIGLRLAFQGAPIIPHYIDFNPGIALVPAAGCFFGPAGAFASLAASLAGDYWLDMWSTLSLFRGAGVFFFALNASALWPVGRKGGWLGYLIVNVVGCFTAASWTGIGTDLTRTYPFAYVSTIVLLHHALFCLVAGPGLYHAGRKLVDVPERDWGYRAAWWVVYGALGSWLLGVFISATFYHQWPFGRYHLSDFAGVGLALCVFPLLLLNLLGSARIGKMIN